MVKYTIYGKIFGRNQLFNYWKIDPAKALDYVSVIALQIAEGSKVLVHCQAGKDRTGLISAIYVIDFKKQPDKALDQLTLKYLYIRTPGRSYPKIINQYFSETSNGAEKSFEEWLKEDYRQMIK